jgi:hypothetical protein
MFTPTLNKKASQFTERLVFVDVELTRASSNRILEDLRKCF